MADTTPKVAITIAIITVVGVIGAALIQKSCPSTPTTTTSVPAAPVSKPEPENKKQEIPPVDLPLRVTAEPIHIEFTGRPILNRGKGCGCGAGDIAFQGGPYSVAVNKEFIFRYDGAGVCRGQGFDRFRGSINWGGFSTQMANNTRNDEYPGIAGSLKVTFSKPGDYNVVTEFSLDCIDFGSANCRNTCRASGTTEVHVR
jgi:hypothetical protein